ncbi:hypothetical protein EUX98_g6323 [Antrodiella citrinella]|uniref:THUMP domain-containing protein n=1 Tax=Antrodiella citrinella TaxID=2447956 RepID=A0A4S4MP90_9APHY|nr:hypothetical protein EUX98_g6323 [Antrodiella citrinella]
MSEHKSGEKRKSEGKDRSRKRYRPDGTPVWGQRSLEGPGIWATCVRNKERSTVGELYDLFESLSKDLWPEPSNADTLNDDAEGSDGEADDGETIEAQIAKEVASMKRPRKEQRFANSDTNTPCVVFISCKPPVNPVQLVVKHVENVMETGVTRTRFTQRLTPVAASCIANIPEIKSLCTRLLQPVLDDDPDKVYKYKVELRIRNHNTVKRMEVIDELAKCMPEKHVVDLDNAELFILVEIFKQSICGISVVKDYYKMQKFNVMEIANTKNEEIGFKEGEGRLAEKSGTDTPVPP